MNLSHKKLEQVKKKSTRKVKKKSGRVEELFFFLLFFSTTHYSLHPKLLHHAPASSPTGEEGRTRPCQWMLMGGPPSLGPKSEAAPLGLGDSLLLLAICSHDDYLLPHVEPYVALSTTGGKTRTGKPAPRNCERGKKRGGMTFCPSWTKLSDLTNVHAVIQTLSRPSQLRTTS